MKEFKLKTCYINKTGDFAIELLRGNNKDGWLFSGNHAHPHVWLVNFRLQSRVVPDDGNWIEIEGKTFDYVSALLATGNVVEFPPDYPTGELPKVIPKYISV